MSDKRIPMIENRKDKLPKIYGDTPSFLGVPVISSKNIPKGFDVIIVGVPWEGTITWNSFSGCELAPRSIRHASARYGGFLPEHNIDLFDYLKIADIGDIEVDPNNSEKTMQNIFGIANKIYKVGSIPFAIGGDHSFTPAIVKGLAKNTKTKIGVIHFDAHFDNLKNFGHDLYPRCGPIYGISQIKNVKKNSIVQIGIRGPRNSKFQYDLAKRMGTRIYDIEEIRRRGISSIIEEAILIAKKGTEEFYVTICSDCVDVAYNSGGPIDFNGLRPDELFFALFRLGEEGLAGLDFVEVYPMIDPRSISSHLASWAIIYALAGLASRKKKGMIKIKEM